MIFSTRKVYHVAVYSLIFIGLISGQEVNPVGGKSGHKPTTIGNLEEFEKCLKSHGVKGQHVVRRSNSLTYEELNYQWQANGEQITPRAFVVVQNEADVTASVKCARKCQVRLIPKGGGHSLEKLSFGNSNTIVVDVRHLTQLEVNMTQMTAKVGAGWLIGPLGWKLWETNKVFTPLGICPTIGISGFTTGGGEGYFSRKLGIALDNIVELSVVTASGDVLKVNAGQNSDLFWALRGGIGSNFGIVTQFVFKIYPVPAQIFVGSLTYPVSSFRNVFDVYQEEVYTAPRDIRFDLDVFDNLVSILFVDITGQDKNFETIRQKFPVGGVTVKDFFTFDNYLLANARFSGEPLLPGFLLNVPADLGKLVRRSPERIYQHRKSFFVQKKIGAEGLRQFDNLIQNMPPGVVTFFEAYGGIMAEIEKNATAWVHRKETRFNAVCNYSNLNFTTTTDHSNATKFVNKFFETGRTIFDHKESYQNYVDFELKDYTERFFGSNLPRLLEVKQKYDPDNFFNNRLSLIPTKL